MPRRLFFALPLLLSQTAEAGILPVGRDQPFPSPSAAAKVAQDGDIVLIEPGEYYDCAVWTQNHLVIAGAGPGVVITDQTCQGKALFVVTGEGTTIRDLTLTRARVPDGNGAAIRQEGQTLTLDHVRFVNNQVALLAGGAGEGSIHISDCAFESGGAGGARPTFAVLVGTISLLRIERSTFNGIKGGQINTSAIRTELAENEIDSGTGTVPVISTQGHLVMQDNVLAIGPMAPQLVAAVLVTGQDKPELRHNRLLNTTGRPLALLLDWTGNDPALESNQIGPGDALLSTNGVLRHRAAMLYHAANDQARTLAGRIMRILLELVRHPEARLNRRSVDEASAQWPTDGIHRRAALLSNARPAA